MTPKPGDIIEWVYESNPRGIEKAKVIAINAANRRPIKIKPIGASNTRPRWIGLSGLVSVNGVAG